MPNWTNINLIYLYDGTFEGFLTTVFYCFENKQIPFDISSKIDFVPSIINYEYRTIETDFSKSSRVFDGLLKISDLVLYYTHNVFLSGNKNKDMILLKYIIEAFKNGANVNNMLTIDSVLQTQKISKQVTFEAQRLKGFIRFSEINEGMFYAKIEPDNNIIEMLSEHFKRRLPNQNWIIHDLKRNLISAYNTKEFIIISAKDVKVPTISEKEKEYQDMWKMFFKTIAIKERTNPRLQKQYMPKRYWKYIFETE